MGARRAALAIASLAALALLVPSSAWAQSIWRLEQPLPPEGVPFKVPLGEPGDLSFWAPNRGLLTVNGNNTIRRGVYSWDGESWHLLASVCGGPDDTARIAWAGPKEFWVISLPSPPRGGSGLALCHFKDGQVVDSFSTRVDSPDPFRQMFAATCNGPDDCWFAGVGSQDPLGERIGAFHLHWDGTALQSFYGPQGRAVSDLEFHEGTLFETALVGRAREINAEPIRLAEPEPVPKLIHRVTAGPQFANDPFEPAPLGGVPVDGTELLALDSDGTNLWAVGGGAASGPSAPQAGSAARPPVALHLVGNQFQELTLSGASFTTTTRFGDVAAIPGTDAAYATAVPYAERRSNNAKAGVARIEADGTTTLTKLPVAGAGRGAAARIACPAPEECWMVTWAGWLFHYTDGTIHEKDTDPAFQTTIEFRPNESAEQFIPDRPPDDDSQLFAPPPVQSEPSPSADLPPVLRRVRSKVKGRRQLRLVVSFMVVRPAAVQLIARHDHKIVGRTPMQSFSPGPGRLALRVTRENYPDKLGFRIRELG
jgi:hypothetical protein